jgi:DNA-directed RNA polymerase specialized sigma24 family protein
MWKHNQIANTKNAEYANAEDFCQIFDKDMSSLYLLSLLLTGNHEKAEQCFVSGLENAVNRNRVFKEWARSWARRVIIQNALYIMKPRPGVEIEALNSTSIEVNRKAELDEIAAVLGLKPFDRFVFVMSVLEGYSEHDCSILLVGCSRRDVRAARIRALQQLGNVTEFLRAHKVGDDRGVSALTGIDASALDRGMVYANSA